MTDEQIIAYIRLRLGGISEEELPDSVTYAFLSVRQAQYPTNEPLVIYYTIIDCVNYLIAKETKEGNAERILQQEGQVMIDVMGLSSVESWQNWLNAFLKQPDIDGLTNIGGLNSVIVGGVSKTEIDRVNNNPDSVSGGYSVGTFFDERYR